MECNPTNRKDFLLPSKNIEVIFKLVDTEVDQEKFKARIEGYKV
jgi:hypothetical protein